MSEVTISFQCSPYYASLLATAYDIMQLKRAPDELAPQTLENFVTLISELADAAEVVMDHLEDLCGTERAQHERETLFHLAARFQRAATGATAQAS